MSKAAEIVTCNETADAFQKLYYEKLDKQVQTIHLFIPTFIILRLLFLIIPVVSPHQNRLFIVRVQTLKC